jgi:pimeloyl-ACP methyl ester carboxylesterase
MKRGSVLLAALLLTGFATTTASAERGIAWRPCDENKNVDCASITVPIDYAHPETGTIDVAIARVKATGKRQGTLVYMPGGPGDSGVERLQRADVVPEPVAERFDVVSFDPRGTNGSHPVVCDANLLADLPNVAPDAGAKLADVQAYARELGNDCRERTGPLIDHVDSVSVARDIDMIRAALGERKITLYGRSYGTLAGQMYAENFPHRVRGLVLDSVFDHSLPVPRFLASQAATTEDSFVGFARWCASDTTCVLHGQDVGQVYGDLYARAVSGELPLPPVMLHARIFSYLYGPDWAGAAVELKELTELTGNARAVPEGAEPFPVAVFCADNRIRISSQGEWMSLWRKMNAATPTMRTHRAWLGLSLCSAWPADTPNPQHRTNIDDDVPPVLLMNGAHDPATSYEWAKGVHRQIDRSVLLTYDGWGHGVTNRTDCADAVFTNYVVNGRTPRPGTHCPLEEK